MTFVQLQAAITTPFFTTVQVQRVFQDESPKHINTQLTRLVKRGLLARLKRGIFLFPSTSLDDFVLANLVYPSSYVSLESALNAYGIIPDVPGQVTSISTLTSKNIATPKGTFVYSKIATELYFGFSMVESATSGIYYKIADPEKALLDFIYIKNIKNFDEARIHLELCDKRKLHQYLRPFPDWVRKVINVAQ